MPDEWVVEARLGILDDAAATYLRDTLTQMLHENGFEVQVVLHTVATPSDLWKPRQDVDVPSDKQMYFLRRVYKEAQSEVEYADLHDIRNDDIERAKRALDIAKAIGQDKDKTKRTVSELIDVLIEMRDDVRFITKGVQSTHEP